MAETLFTRDKGLCAKIETGHVTDFTVPTAQSISVHAYHAHQPAKRVGTPSADRTDALETRLAHAYRQIRYIQTR